jgi:DNA-binding MarR family transcriptional regulator
MDQAHELTNNIVSRLLTLIRYQHRFSHKMRSLYGIGGRQLSVLRFLQDEGPQSVGDISRHLWVRDATASPLLERMEEDGYVLRKRSLIDSRRLIVEATDKGRAICQEAPTGPITTLRQELPLLPAAELDALLGALDRLVELADVDPDIAE